MALASETRLPKKRLGSKSAQRSLCAALKTSLKVHGYVVTSRAIQLGQDLNPKP